MKTLIGVTGSSIALVADGIHTLADTFTSLAVWIGLKIARRPADTTHPYGHGKAEPIAAKVVAIALFLVAGGIAFESIKAILAHFAGTAELAAPTALTLYAALLSIFAKELLYQYQVRIGRKVSSVALIADAWHHRSDAFSSVAVAAGIAVAVLAGETWRWADQAAALAVAVFIAWIAWDLFKQSAAGIMDTPAADEVESEIRRVAGAVEGVLGIEKTFARRSGLDVLVDIHVEVDPRMSVETGHEIASRVTRELTETIPEVTHALVHIEPYRGTPEG